MENPCSFSFWGFGDTAARSLSQFDGILETESNSKPLLTGPGTADYSVNNYREAKYSILFLKCLAGDQLAPVRECPWNRGKCTEKSHLSWAEDALFRGPVGCEGQPREIHKSRLQQVLFT